MYKDNWTQPRPMGSEIYPEIHENPRAFFSSPNPILLESLAHGSSDWSLTREDCIRMSCPPPCKSTEDESMVENVVGVAMLLAAENVARK